METKIYDKETGSTIYMEGTIANMTARIEDEYGDVIIEFKNGHLLEFNKIMQNLGNENNELEECGMEPEYQSEDEEPKTQENLKVGELYVLKTPYHMDFEEGTILELTNIDSGEFHKFKNSEGLEEYVRGDSVEIIDSEHVYEKFEFAKKSDITLTVETSLKGCSAIVTQENMWYDVGTVVEIIEDGNIPKLTDHNGEKWYTCFDKISPYKTCQDETEKEKWFYSIREGDFIKVTKTIVDDWGDIVLPGVHKIDSVGHYTSNIYVLGEDGNKVIINKDKNLDSIEKNEFKIGEIVEVKEGNDCGGAVGYAMIKDIHKDGTIVLEGRNVVGRYSNHWYNTLPYINKLDKE